MTDRPIIFSAPMVRALLAGTKTQTRRVLGPGTSFLDGSPWPRGHAAQSWRWDRAWVDPGPSPAGNAGPYLKVPRGDDQTVHRVYPIWWLGMRLWVREAWAPLTALTHNDPGTRALADRGFYRADRGTVDGEIGRWRPSIHMPRWASRLTLTVTDVRVQRLQNISEADAWAEGVQTWAQCLADDPAITDGHIDAMVKEAGDHPGSGRNGFACLWNSINGPGAWQANPWVAAISFSVERRNIDG